MRRIAYDAASCNLLARGGFSLARSRIRFERILARNEVTVTTIKGMSSIYPDQCDDVHQAERQNGMMIVCDISDDCSDLSPYSATKKRRSLLEPVSEGGFGKFYFAS